MKIDLERRDVIAIVVGVVLIVVAIYWKFLLLALSGIGFIASGIGADDLNHLDR